MTIPKVLQTVPKVLQTVPNITLSKSQKAAVGILAGFVLRAVLDSVQQGHLNVKDVENAALAGALAGCRAILPSLSGLGRTGAADKTGTAGPAQAEAENP